MIRRDKHRRQVRDAKPLRRAVVLGSAETKTTWRAANVIDDERRDQRAELRIAAATAGDLCDDLGTRQGGKDD
jgi:hypothetical protein